MRSTLARLACVSLTLLSTAALAHEETGQAAGFLAGLAHPVSGLDHVLAMVSVGLWGAQLGAPALWLLPVTFPMVMAFGGMLGLMGVPLPGVEVGIALSGILLGLAVLEAYFNTGSGGLSELDRAYRAFAAELAQPIADAP